MTYVVLVFSNLHNISSFMILMAALSPLCFIYDLSATKIHVGVKYRNTV